MKKKLSYFNAEERNGFYLLSFMLFLFSTFIFLQKRILPSHSNISIVENTVLNGEIVADPLKLKGEFNDQKLRKTTKASKKFKKRPLESRKPEALKIKAREIITDEKDNQEISKKVGVPLKKQGYTSAYHKPKNQISINSQNMDEWMSLYGIGPKYAERIIKYQTWLGGFHKKEQLMEVYGITDTLFQSLESQLLPSKPYTLILINQLEIKDLARHPYIDWKMAKKIVNYRKHHESFQNEKDMRKMKGIDEASLIKILPYMDYSVQINLSSS